MKKIRIGNHIYDCSKKTLIMGILNVTPDSFSDGGLYTTSDEAVSHALEMIQQGADIIDIGGESTRPGSEPISVEEELERIIPVIQRLSDKTSIPLSVDTSKAEVACQALDHGASLINDISALQADPYMVDIISAYHVPICLMHMKGNPTHMQDNPIYDDIIDEIKHFFKKQISYAVHHQIPKDHIILDPGIGFGKRTGKGIEDNCTILTRLEEFQSFGCPLLIGASRKTFIGNICGEHGPLPPNDRLEGSLAAACIAVLHGANILRVHDVKETKRVLRFINCSMNKTYQADRDTK